MNCVLLSEKLQRGDERERKETLSLYRCIDRFFFGGERGEGRGERERERKREREKKRSHCIDEWMYRCIDV